MKLKRAIFYMLLFFTAVVFFLVLRFPGRQVAAYMSHVLNSSTPGIQWKIETTAPVLPLGLKLGQLSLSMDENIQIFPDAVTALLSPVTLFKDKKQMDVKAQLQNGNVQARFHIDHLDPFVFSDAELSVSHLEVKDFNWEIDTADVNIAFELTGEFRQKTTPGGQAAGHGKFAIQNFTAAFTNSVFNRVNMPVIDFSKIDIQIVSISNTRVNLHCTAKGSVMNITLEGYIEPVFPLQQSRIHFSGTLLPDPRTVPGFSNMPGLRSKMKYMATDGIKFNVDGMLDSPKIGV